MHGLLQAITHKVSWMMVQVAGAFWFLHASGMGLFGMEAFYPAIVASVLAIGLLLKGEGFMGLIELPSIISNIVSYARIMAVGLASVFLAILINNTASGLYEMGMLWFIVLGIPLIIVGHGFNLALGIFSPFLHSVRLHYVEFFTKFYQGGGKEFSPFGVNADK
jgi:V/A-type H+-transporting ATPase subunit I